MRDQSQVGRFSAWSELNYFVYQKLSSRDAFLSDIIIERNKNLYCSCSRGKHGKHIDYEQSLSFLLLAVYDRQKMISFV